MEPYQALTVMSTQRVVALAKDSSPLPEDLGVDPSRPLGPPAFYEIAVSVLVLILGALEGWYRRTDFSTDAISYLDISRAIPLKDWKMIFNPLWSVGYPLL